MVPDHPGASPEERHTKERLLVAARQLFASRGFAGVSVREICAQAHANPASINYYFSSKENLYLEVLREAFRAVRREPVAASSPHEAYRALQSWVHELVRRNLSAPAAPWENRLLWRELIDPTPAMEVLVRETIEPDMASLRGVLRVLQPDLSEERSFQWTLTLLGHVLIYSFARRPILALMRKERYHEEDLRAVECHLLEVLRKGLGFSGNCAEETPRGTL